MRTRRRRNRKTFERRSRRRLAHSKALRGFKVSYETRYHRNKARFAHQRQTRRPERVRRLLRKREQRGVSERCASGTRQDAPAEKALALKRVDGDPGAPGFQQRGPGRHRYGAQFSGRAVTRSGLISQIPALVRDPAPATWTTTTTPKRAEQIRPRANDAPVPQPRRRRANKPSTTGVMSTRSASRKTTATS